MKNWKNIPIEAWLAFILSSLFYALQFALRVSPGVMTDELMAAFGVDAVTLGVLVSFYYYGYAPFQVPAGMFLDRFGSRMTFLVSLMVCFLGGLLFTTGHLFSAYLGRFLMGLGSAASFLICMKVVSEFFPKSMFPGLTSFAMLIGTVGAVGGGEPLALSTNHFGWSKTMMGLSLLCFLLFAFTMVLFRKGQDNPDAGDELEQRFIDRVKKVLKAKHTWFAGIYGILMYVPLSAFCDLWGIPFMEKFYGLPEETAARSVSLIYVGLGLFSLASPVLLSKLGSYKKTFLLSSAASALVFFAILMKPTTNLYAVYLMMFLLGGCLSPQILAFAFISERNSARMSGFANGIHNMLCMLSGVLAQPLIAVLLHYVSATPDEISGRTFQICLGTILVSIVAAGAVSLALPEEKPS